jgi:hypothetical protein
MAAFQVITYGQIAGVQRGQMALGSYSSGLRGPENRRCG